MSKRDLILYHAEEMMRVEGLSQLSMNHLANRANVAKGTLYIYFKNKEDVIGQVTIKARECLLEYFQKAANREEEPIGKIRSLLMSMLDFRRDHPLYMDLVSFYEVNRDLVETDELQASSQAITDFVYDLLRHAQSAQFVDADIDVAETTMMMWGMTIGMLQLIDSKSHLVEGFLGHSSEVFYQHYIDHFLRGLKKNS